MSNELNELAEKKLKSRIRKLKKVNKDNEEKEKFFSQLAASFEVFLPSRKPEEQSDSIILYTSVEGDIVDAEYSYHEGEDFVSLTIGEKDLKVLFESFKDYSLEFNE